ncbi:four helix bundle protein [Opitutus terrae]|uniref:S23 ribosomal protein n=1 Tax=Opitutus terrae (strain DSM 11246 / JCM 15787 / PB90-1) TaxID=452637 RepID=B1ZXY4_OPITP|nr:four helix bundle protein [Opitutus terrae]ACB75186.1 S23 ribosomal protein [Opitutus terrae PB90-1]
MKDYRQLNTWKHGHAVTLSAYRLTKTFPKEELFGLTSQIRRAASSVPANIAEGCGREGDAELKRFLNIALGSACELDYHILLASDLGYIDAPNAARLAGEILQLRRMLGAFIRRLEN